MIISYNFLKTLCSSLKRVKLVDLCQDLMNLGCEVEQIIPYQQDPFIAVFQIMQITAHPTHKKLKVLNLKNQDKQIQIITNQTYLQAKDYVLVAQVGARIGDITITERAFGELVSQGMLLSVAELDPTAAAHYHCDDLAQVITDTSAAGVKQKLQALDLSDYLLDLSLPSNRNELNGYHFLCKELAALHQKTFQSNERTIIRPLANDFINGSMPNLVNNYFLAEIKDFQEPISFAQKVLLARHNITVHNNLNDHLDYLTLMTANPMHAFDADLITSSLEVKTLDKPTSMLGIDQKTYQLEAGDLVLCDGSKIVALCGIMGAYEYRLTPQTKRVYIECANFDFVYIKKTASRLKINSLAANLFAKPLNVNITYLTAQYLQTYFQDALTWKHIGIKQKMPAVSASMIKLQNVIGTTNLKISSIINFFELLGYKINRTHSQFHAPFYRCDVLNAFDIYEDAMKLYDINKVAAQPVLYYGQISQKNTIYDLIYSLKTKLQAYNLIEAKTYQLKAKDNALAFNWYHKEQDLIEIQNPISMHKAFLKLNNVDSLLDVLMYNIHYKNNLFNVFECVDLNVLNKPKALNLTLVCPMPLIRNTVNKDAVNNNLLTMKSLVSMVCKHFCLDFSYLPNTQACELNPQQSLALSLDDVNVHGYVGLMTQKSLKQYDLNEPVYLLNMNIPYSFIKQANPTIYCPISTTHDVIKDVSIAYHDDVDLTKVLDELNQQDYIVQTQIIDAYQKDQATIYTIRVNINLRDQNLDNNQIKNYLEQIENILKSYL
ncbi:phenylalanine--tRNA ligase subunit beta [Ureaplasma miroungigenitalium]|uniref:Phenylalanine--tRNA ligase beta subunit n=1 Tax=Ureaplasma miroungigenitalium TaxID=1042321 RepID=A0ABT3BM31_9BACT|nr:phenylalanine--tRNA ligase subunit beta [Ureaplasma miroungigenitalium]MCV3728297.1 phenylalanine--tRNA ligase subunit beta [Ureaplasma miroungigenitalium]MCV3734102.1 phenylalanine--tRNA ligase subunit beta [Ureaplasma miroungigenitalium]